MRSDMYLTIVLIALAALNGVISFGVVRSVFYSRRQKAAQIGLVWFLPMLGPALVGVILWSNYGPRVRSRQSAAGAVAGMGADDLLNSMAVEATDQMRDAHHL